MDNVLNQTIELRATLAENASNANSHQHRIWSLGTSDGNGTTIFDLSVEDVELLKDTLYDVTIYVTYETKVMYSEGPEGDKFIQKQEIHTKRCPLQKFTTFEWNCEY